MEIIHLDEVSSTNSHLARMAPTLNPPVMLIADSQSAGRGQRGNSWEAEPGKNITMSVLLEPRHVAPRDQFAISRAVSLAVVEVLDPILEPVGKRAEIKWPNDIYVDDMKLAGILIEHTIDATSIARTIVGIGLNVNQTLFRSDAPNPVSLCQITGRDDLQPLPLATAIARAIAARVDGIDSPTALCDSYMRRLWRRDGAWPYRDAATAQLFEASVVTVDRDGRLQLSDTRDRQLRSYYFKEVAAVIG